MKSKPKPPHVNGPFSALGVILALLAGCSFLFPSRLPGAVVIDLPEIVLLPDMPGQSFDVYVQNTGASVLVNGIGFNIQVADGGAAAGGTISGPAITSVDLFTGTVFGPNNNGLSGGGSIVPQVYERGTLTAGGTVSIPNGLSKVATVTLDTTGFGSGTFLLTLNTHNGPTKYTTLGEDLFPALIDGSVAVAAVPEPGAWVLVTGAALILFAGLRTGWRHRPSSTRSLLLIAGCALVPGPMQAALAIGLPELKLLPNLAGQSFDVFLENTGAPVWVTGIGFNIQVADGGPAAGGNISGPAITLVDILDGTAFGSNNNGLSGGGSLVPQVYERGTMTSSGLVSLPNGWSKVATVTLDTTGFGSGTFGLKLNTVNGPTRYTTSSGDLYPALIEGSVALVPLPSISAIAVHHPSLMALTFSTTTGFQYRAQCAHQLVPPEWTNVFHGLAVGDPLTLVVRQGTGLPQTIFVAMPNSAGNFFRISMEREGI